MSKEDKTKITELAATADQMLDKLKSAVFIKQYKSSTLITGSTFNDKIKTIEPNATSIVFTNEPIPSNKIPKGIIVSTDDSEVKSYMYSEYLTIYISPEESDTIIYANENCFSMFNNCRSLTSLDLSNFDTSNVTDMSGMFNYCNSLTSLDVSNFDTSKVTNMNGMFYVCTSLTSLDLSNWNTSKVTSMVYIFGECKLLTLLDLSNFDTSRVTDMSYMFYDCSSLTSLDLSNFDTSKVTNMRYMFNNCNSLTSLDLSNWNTSNVTNMNFMFNYCESLTSLDLSNFDTSNVTNMSEMFYGCESLTSLDVSNFDTSRVTDMSYMFDDCSLLTSLDVSNFDTSNVTDMRYMFYNCIILTGYIIIKNPNISSYSNMFKYTSTEIGSKFVVDYISSTKEIATKMIATKSSNSNVVLKLPVLTNNLADATMWEIYNAAAIEFLDTIPADWGNYRYYGLAEDDKTIIGYMDDYDKRFYITADGKIELPETFNAFSGSPIIFLKGMDTVVDTSNCYNMSNLFKQCHSLTGAITIMNPNMTEYTDIFKDCSTDFATFTVNYIDDATKAMAEKLIATKSSNSKVVLGSLVNINTI